MSEFIDSQSVREYLLGLQQRIVARFEQFEDRPFLCDLWEKPADAPLGGGGLTRILESGELLERGGVGFSHVVGTKLPPSATAQRPELAGRGFEAMGVSLVFHPRNPYVPTVHMNPFSVQGAGATGHLLVRRGMD
jgi:coproporphyrinogen III oxidase